MSTTIKSLKVRLLPTPEQEQLLWQHIGASRYIWNYMLDYQQKNYEAGGKYLSAFSMINLLKPLKNDGEHEWLYDVSNATLGQVCRDVDKSFQRFFKKKGGHPKYKSRKNSKASYPVRAEHLYFVDKTVNVEKVGKIAYQTDRGIPQGKGQKFLNPRIQYTSNKKWILSFGMEFESQDIQLTDKPMGIDLGVKELAVVAFGEEKIVYHNINKSKKVRRLESKLKHLRRKQSRKYLAQGKSHKGKKYVKTKNILKVEQQIREAEYHLANIRLDYIHKTTHSLVSMLPCRVIMEDLNVLGMMKNKHLSKAVAQQRLSEFIRQMKYKCEWSGIEFIQADRFYPSSKTCSCCGNIKKDLKLSDRVYKCDCGLVIDRDYNAAINLMRYTAQYKETVA